MTKMRRPKYSPECPTCKSTATHRKGLYSRAGVGYFRFRCKACSSTFTRLIPQEIPERELADGDYKRLPRIKPNQGENHPQAKLKSQDVLDILVLKDSGSSPEELAARYGVAKATIISALNGTTWSTLTGIQPKTPKLPPRYKQRGR